MNREYEKSARFSFNGVLYRIVGILLMLTLLTTCMLSRLHAKYIVYDSRYDSARVASAGIGKLELWEHEAKETAENSGVYELDNKKTVTKNEYKKVLPGVDIPKDPYIELEISGSEVSYELYVKVVKSTPFPDSVTFALTNDWELVDSADGIYKYKSVFEAGTAYQGVKIQILKDNKLYVSELYDGKSQNFSLTFSAYLMQVHTN